jgi:[acyl-carrier-protein] S-malonyltransferase
MGQDLYTAAAPVRALYDEASEVLGFDLAAVSFTGPEDALRQTRITQPALYVHSYTLQSLLRERGVLPDMTAGHSLGEFTAFAAAGSLAFADGLKLVKVRAEAMSNAAAHQPGTMAAIIGLDHPALAALCKEASTAGIVTIANVNSPGQLVVSGSRTGVEKLVALASAAGARRAVLLPVSGAFHSPLMEPAQKELAFALAAAPFAVPDVPVYCNVTARPCQDTAEIRQLLERQLTSPVLWTTQVEQMIADGAEEFIEIGSGKVLAGLVKRINPNVRVRSVGTLQEITQFT